MKIIYVGPLRRDIENAAFAKRACRHVMNEGTLFSPHLLYPLCSVTMFPPSVSLVLTWESPCYPVVMSYGATATISRKGCALKSRKQSDLESRFTG